MNKSLYFLFLLVTIGLFSCETDIDVNAEYKDIPVIYGLIDPLESVHYVKVNKAFLGTGNALDLAANANSFNYADGEIDVIVEEWNTQGLVQSYALTRTVNEITKDPGIFDTSENVLYKFTENAIDIDNTYKLKVVNSSLSKEITAETKIVKPTVVSQPANKNGKFSFWLGAPATGVANDITISVTSGADVGRVKASLVFNYTENYTIASGKAPVVKRVVMHVGEKQTSTSFGNESLEWEFKSAAFFDNISSTVSSPSTVADFSHRELINISLEFSIAGNELSTFMEVSAPSTSVNQDKPNYTNIENGGIGIFSSREKMIWLSTVNPAGGQVNLHDNTITFLQSLNLGFCFGNSITSSYKCTQL